MSDSSEQGPGTSAVPLFPLPNVVLFPCAVLPLHIFEERYKMMTAHALVGDRRVAMALLRGGWERDYYGRPAIDPVVCVGRILAHERLPDGKYNFLLQGETRATVRKEISAGTPYRLAEIETLAESPVMEIDLADYRRRMVEMFGESRFSSTGIGRKFAEILSGSMMTADVADLIAFNFVEDVLLKQSLLGDADIRRRVGRVVQAIDELRAGMGVGTPGRRSNPSMN